MLNKQNPIDAIDDFLSFFKIDVDDFCNYAAQSIIRIQKSDVSSNWNEILRNIQNNSTIYVRSYGNNRNKETKTENQHLLDRFYREVLGLSNVQLDSTNNSKPTQLIQRATGYIKGKNLSNYKVSHVWERSLNPFAFTAGWNIVYTPVIVDPFTGHETSHELTERITKHLRKSTYQEYENEINEYNLKMAELERDINSYLEINGEVFGGKLQSRIKESFSVVDF